MNILKLLQATTLFLIMGFPAALAQDYLPHSKMSWIDDIQPIHKCQYEAGWAHYGKGSIGGYSTMCTTHPNVDGKTWVIRGDTKYGKSDGQKYIQISINGERIPNGQARYSQCKGYATFGSEPRARSRDCLNHIMKNKEINKGIYDLMGNRFKSKGRVTMEPGFDRIGGQYATLSKTNVKECQAKCIADKVCKVFTHARETCYLKAGSSGTVPAAPSTTAGRKW